MSSRLTLPHSQQRHSNIAVVRLTRGNKRVEIACYKNKVVAFRAGAETNIDEVLQIDRVFTSVARGEYASQIDFRHVIDREDISERDAIEHILRHGALQVASGERNMSQEETLRDICTIVAQKVVHAHTKRPFSAIFIEEAVKSLGISVRPDQPAKKQAMQIVKDLCAKQIIPVVRAQMRLRISGCGVEPFQQFAPSTVEVSDNEIVIDVDPEHFRAINELCATKGCVATVLNYAISDTTYGDESAFVVGAAQQPPPSKTQDRKMKREQRRLAREERSDDDSD
jgi:ribosome maturation protein SDO1